MWLNPVEIRGIQYPSQAAAARHLGISAQAVGSALDRGKLDGVGLGRNALTRCKITLVSKEYPEGKVFASIADCARYLGIKPVNLHSLRCRARKEGRSHAFGRWGKITWKDKPKKEQTNGSQ